MSRAAGDDGSALVEFVALAVLLCLPLAYVVTAVARVQAATVATTTAAREAARAYVTAGTPASGAVRARAAASLAYRDQGMALARDALEVRCERGPCLSPGSRVRVAASARVRLPLVPDLWGGGTLAVPVSAVSLLTVDVHRSAP